MCEIVVVFTLNHMDERNERNEINAGSDRDLAIVCCLIIRADESEVIGLDQNSLVCCRFSAGSAKDI